MYNEYLYNIVMNKSDPSLTGSEEKTDIMSNNNEKIVEKQVKLKI